MDLYLIKEFIGSIKTGNKDMAVLCLLIFIGIRFYKLVKFSYFELKKRDEKIAELEKLICVSVLSSSASKCAACSSFPVRVGGITTFVRRHDVIPRVHAVMAALIVVVSLPGEKKLKFFILQFLRDHSRTSYDAGFCVRYVCFPRQV